MKRSTLQLCKYVAATALALTQTTYAMAADGLMTAKVVLRSAKFVIDFLDAASSNASAAAAVDATSISQGLVNPEPEPDTGYFRATAENLANSGTLAHAYAYADADYNFFSANVHTVKAVAEVSGKDGLQANAYADTRIKGIPQIIKEAILTKQSEEKKEIPVAELVIPVHFSFEMNSTSTYDFEISLFQINSSDTIILAKGFINSTKKYIEFPYLEKTSPLLAESLRENFLKNVSQGGVVSFDLGVDTNRAEVDTTGLPVTLRSGEGFQLNSSLGAQGSMAAVPEPASWVLGSLGFPVLIALRKMRPTTKKQGWACNENPMI
jgi:hypothetical protein